jgi:hypothetical protein
VAPGRQILGCIAAVAAIVVGVNTAPSAARATAAPVASPPAVFLQVSSLGAFTPATVRLWLKAYCAAADEPPGLVLQDIASAKGALQTKYLDLIAPMLPGGRHACFGQVFVGTVDQPWQGTGSKYVQGIKDPAFRAKYLQLSLLAAREFRARYPDVRNDWYLTYEANLNELYYDGVATSYQSLLTREIDELSSVRAGRSVLWSPAFWYPYSVYRHNSAGMAGLKNHLTRLFTATQRASGDRMQIALQDFVGGSSCEPPANRITPRDAVGWIGFLQEMNPLKNVALNVDQFIRNCETGEIVAGSPTAIHARERFYRGEDVALGPTFELRYWLCTHLAADRLCPGA